MGKVPQGATVQGPTGIREKWPVSTVAMAQRALAGETPPGA